MQRSCNPNTLARQLQSEVVLMILKNEAQQKNTQQFKNSVCDPHLSHHARLRFGPSPSRRESCAAVPGGPLGRSELQAGLGRPGPALPAPGPG